MGYYIKGNKRLSVFVDSFDILSSEFWNFHTSEIEGGGFLINASSGLVSVSRSLFSNCSAFKRGGAFSIIAASSNVVASCSCYCFLNYFQTYFNGNGGNIDAKKIRHNLSLISQCVPKKSQKVGNCLFGLRRSDDAKAKDINASDCDGRGYVFSDCKKASKISYFMINNINNQGLIFFESQPLTSNFGNILNSSGSGLMNYENFDMIIINFVFLNNVRDVETSSFFLKQCMTDKQNFNPAKCENCTFDILDADLIFFNNIKCNHFESMPCRRVSKILYALSFQVNSMN